MTHDEVVDDVVVDGKVDNRVDAAMVCLGLFLAWFLFIYVAPDWLEKFTLYCFGAWWVGSSIGNLYARLTGQTREAAKDEHIKFLRATLFTMMEHVEALRQARRAELLHALQEQAATQQIH